MPQTTTVEVWVVVSASGDHAAGTTEERAAADYEEQIQPLNEAGGYRLVKVTLTVPLPEVIEVAAEVAAAPESVAVSTTAA